MPHHVVHPQVALRRERFGALAYHYGNRRLTFLNDALLLAVVEHLGVVPDDERALEAAGVPAARRPAYRHALAALADAEVLVAAD